MPGHPEPARCPQRRWTGLASGGQVDRGTAFGLLNVGLGPGRFLLDVTLLGNESGGGLPPLLAQPTPLRGWGDEDSGMQLLTPAHNARPRV